MKQIRPMLEITEELLNLSDDVFEAKHIGGSVLYGYHIRTEWTYPDEWDHIVGVQPYPPLLPIEHLLKEKFERVVCKLARKYA